MTRCTVVADAEKSLVTVDLKIDFTRILGDPVVHYELTQMALEESRLEKERLVKAIQSGLTILVDGEALGLVNTEFIFPDLPLNKFTEPWAAPMSELTFEAELPLGASELRVTSKPGLLIEYPLVVSLV